MRPRFLALLVVTTCGLAPQEKLTGRRIGDGVSPWQDLGALRMCMGSRRIGPAGSAVGGFCAGHDAPAPAACVRDDDCGSRERCTCGRCVVQYCTTSGECGPERACSFSEHRCVRPCVADDDCPSAGEYCRNGSCQSRCRDDGDCQAGEVCASSGTSRRCVVVDCTADGDCLADEFCDVQREPRVALQPTVLGRADDDPPGAPPFTMWIEMSDRKDEDLAIWRATSDDGLSFRLEPTTPVLEDGGDAHAPSVIRRGAGFRLYYESQAGIMVAESADGVAFASPTLAFAGDFHAPAAVASLGAGDLVFVHVGDRQGIALWPGTGAPSMVLAPGEVTDAVLWRSVERLGSPSATVQASSLGEPTLHLWFDAHGMESESAVQLGETVVIPPNDSIGFASAPLASPESLAIYPFNPVFDRVVAFLEHRAERAPTVVRVPDTARRREAYFLYYEGEKADGSESDGIGVAANPGHDHAQ